MTIRALLDEALIRLPDLNRDGRPELLFDAYQADCQRNGESVTIACGADTCKTRVFTEQGGQGWRVAWSGEPFAYVVDFSQPDPRMWAQSTDCDEGEPERKSARCSGSALVWQDAARAFALMPVSAMACTAPAHS